MNAKIKIEYFDAEGNLVDVLTIEREKYTKSDLQELVNMLYNDALVLGLKVIGMSTIGKNCYLIEDNTIEPLKKRDIID